MRELGALQLLRGPGGAEEQVQHAVVADGRHLNKRRCERARTLIMPLPLISTDTAESGTARKLVQPELVQTKLVQPKLLYLLHKW